MDKRSRLIRPEEDHSSSSSGADKPPTRYKIIAPKRPSAPWALESPPALEEETTPKPDLTFVNVTDPLQSKSQESRKLVRTQVMKNFAREQKKHRSRSDMAAEERRPSVTLLLDPLLSPQRVLAGPFLRAQDIADSGQSLAPLSLQPSSSTGRPSAAILGEALRPRPGRSRSLPSATDRTIVALPLTSVPPATSMGLLAWPLSMEPHNHELKSHCFSPNFRASNPLYMISLLAKRAGAELYPLCIDIDSPASTSEPRLNENLLFRLAETSASLAHALLMVSASDLALRQVNKARNDRQVIYHKSRALALLNEAIRDASVSGSLETLATAAVLASHELVVGDYNAWTVHILGFSRMIEMKGGINVLPRENAVRQLILWSDQIGALFMNMRPLFQASAVFAASFRLRPNVPESLSDEFALHHVQAILAFQHMRTEGKLSAELVEILEEVSFVAVMGAETILSRSEITTTQLIELRDTLIYRMLYLSPDSQDGGDEYSFEECVRLTALLLTLDRLFSPVLPCAYFQITHMVADRLAAAIDGHPLAADWIGHEWVALWVCFIGTSVSSNNPRTRNSFIGAAAPVCQQLFTGFEQMAAELDTGMKEFMSAPQLYGSEMIETFASDLQEELTVQLG